MILTVTLNPAMDHLLFVPDANLGGTNRAKITLRTPGGKGVNVANTLAVLGEEVVATGFLGGLTGQVFEESLRRIGVTTNFIFTNQELRTDFYLIEENKEEKTEKERQTMIIEEGFSVELRYLNHFKSNFKRLLSSNVNLIEIGGSLPKGVSPVFIRELVEEANNNNVKVVLNLKESLLEECWGKTKLFIVHPDTRECTDLLCKNFNNEKVRIEVSKEIINKGAEVVLINYGQFDYFVATKNECWEGKIEPDPNIQLILIGARDGMLAGFMKNYLEEENVEKALKYGLATALSTARNKLNYPNSKEEVDHLYSKTIVKKVG